MKSCNNCQKSVDGCEKRKGISHKMLSGEYLHFRQFINLINLEQFWCGVGEYCSEFIDLDPYDFERKKRAPKKEDAQKKY